MPLSYNIMLQFRMLCIYYIHKTPDMNPDFNFNISQPILIPKNEKTIFDKFKKYKKQHKSSTKDKKIANHRYNYFSKTSIEINKNRSIDIEPENKSNNNKNNYKNINYMIKLLYFRI